MKVGIAGATGLVGQEMLSVLQESNLSFSEIKLFASAGSEGRTYKFRGSTLPVEIIKKSSMEKGMIILGATSSEVALNWVPQALEAGATVIDNSSAYRMDGEVPLVVPEVNGNTVKPSHRLIANPNCSTIQLVMALKPLRELSPMNWISVSTYQSVSGAGREGTDALMNQEGRAPEEGGVHRNILCEIGDVLESGYTGEELKLIHETAKIMGEEIPVFPACARVPVMVGHTESVTVMFREPVDAETAGKALAKAPGVVRTAKGCEPLKAAETNETFAGRIRNHPFDNRILQFWVTADNVRKGAALNAVQILELVAGIRA